MSVKCMLCGIEYDALTNTHLGSVHNVTVDEYREMFPNAEFRDAEARQRIATAVSKTKMGHEVSIETRRLLAESLAGNKNRLGHRRLRDVCYPVPPMRKVENEDFGALPSEYILEQFEEWLTEFNNGDGSIGVYNNHGYPHVRVSFCQMDRDVLTYISNYFGKGSYGQGVGGLWTLSYNGKSAMPFLEIFSRYVVGRYMFERLCIACDVAGLPRPILHRPTMRGFIGLWDAEGWSSFQDYTFSIGVSQSDKGLFDSAKELFRVYCDALSLGGGINRHNDCPSGANWQWVLYRAENVVLLKELLMYSLNPVKVKELRYNLMLEGFLVPESVEETCIVKADREARQERRRAYNDLHSEEHSARAVVERAEKIKVQTYMREHPEIVERLKMKVEV